MLLVAGGALAQQCPAPSVSDLSKIAGYVAARYELAPDLSVDDGGPVKGTCFRHFTVRASAPRRSIALYASPDLRFLTEELLDTLVDPAKERERMASETQKDLLADNSPSRGSDDAQVTVVEFSDFQCPYCKRFEGFLSALQGDDARQVRVVYKHLPLAMHEWARPAAELSICASFQKPDAFWKLDDFLASKQSSLTTATLLSTAESFLSQELGLDARLLNDCVESHGASEVLMRDERLARLYHVEGTPTIFINGVRSASFRSIAELQSAVHSALISVSGRGSH
jgi:protein-disulfide isomerase